MKVCIVGAGAIGGLIGAKLSATGVHQVSALARGATLAALRRHGFRLREGSELQQSPVAAVEHARVLGEQDLVIIAVKAPSMAAVAASVAPLLGPQTIVLPAMNGVPWWFGAATPALGPEPLASVDPGGAIAAAIPFERVVGCVVHASALVAEPGLVVHKMGRALLIGEPLGGLSERVETLRVALEMAGFETTASADIRRGAWYKLWGNLVMNPVSAMTGATADRILDDPLVRRFCNAAMAEAATVGERIGCTIDQTPEDRNAVTRKLGAFKTSMLQDAEGGRPIELDAIVAAVAEIGQRVGVPTPNIDALLGLTRLFGRVHGLYPDPPP
ncbi:2-dehydropantoate 2-reductase [Aquabacterium humicola]|uniref:2-dehydropantoate 2-reductase n=1 Tax=Aquabacterium humicola TaxID=3237377 RepID=UPI0025431FB0|nr:2-dehydropantoate 2-reductase [Rubrivivax pictus]